jgi:TolB-like protein
MPLTPGTRLGPYEIVAPLGAGGMGEVYRARDSKLGRDVAIKAMPRSLAAGPELLARFEREAQILASLNHPNIGAIYGREDEHGVPHLVLELVPGETLAARLERGPLALRETLALCVQIAAAIEAAHEQGIVHRDLKPGNVMITPSGVAKVLDFGLAKGDLGFSASSSSISPTVAARPDATVAGTIVGTLAYLSPEQARGLAVDRRSDLWAFACVVYECLTARQAFAGATPSDLIARILEREPDWSLLPPGVPPRLRDVLKRCLRKNADERPRDIRDVRLELAEMAAGGDKAATEREKSVAVLPFENLSAADDEYFADGMTEEILGALVQVEGLRVAARTSCFAFKGKREDLRVVGEKLDVATVLEGSVRRSGNRLRISVQLVNAADGYQLWSERYDREMTDVFEVQDEIAGAIVKRLSLSLQSGSDGAARTRRGTKNLEAYELMLKGRALQLKRGRHLLQAMPVFERAIELDPQYAEAIACLADCYRLLGTFGMRPPVDVMPRGKALALQALEIQPDLPEANATLATIQAQFERDWPSAMASWERVFASDPRHVRSICERALWAQGMGKFTNEFACAETARAVAEDPLNAWVLGMNSFMYGFWNKHAEAMEFADRAMAVDPESFFVQWQQLRSRAWAGEYVEACKLGAAFLENTGRNPWMLSTLCWCRAQLGDKEQAEALCDELLARSRQEFVAPGWTAVALDAAGRHEEAVAMLARAFHEQDPMIMLSTRSPWFDGLCKDARFAELSKGIWT